MKLNQLSQRIPTISFMDVWKLAEEIGNKSDDIKIHTTKTGTKITRVFINGTIAMRVEEINRTKVTIYNNDGKPKYIAKYHWFGNRHQILSEDYSLSYVEDIIDAITIKNGNEAFSLSLSSSPLSNDFSSIFLTVSNVSDNLYADTSVWITINEGVLTVICDEDLVQHKYSEEDEKFNYTTKETGRDRNIYRHMGIVQKSIQFGLSPMEFRDIYSQVIQLALHLRRDDLEKK